MAVAEPPRGGAERSGAGRPQNGGGAGCGRGGGVGRAAAGTGRHRAAWGWPRSRLLFLLLLLFLLTLGGCGAVEASGGQDGSSPAAGPQRAARAGPPPARPLRCLPQGEGARLGAARPAACPSLRLLTVSFLRSAPTSSWLSSRREETGARAKRWWWWTRSTRSACCSAAPWPAASSASMCAAPRERRRPASGSSWGLVCCWGFCASSGVAPSPLSWLWRPGVWPSPATLPAGHAVTGLGTSRNQSSVCGASLRQSLVLLTKGLVV